MSEPRIGGGLLWPILPDATSSELLRACLAPAHAGDAFSRWCAVVGDPLVFLRMDQNGRHRALLPLLERSLRLAKPPVALDASLRTLVRTSALHERSRSENLAKVFCDVANVLSGARIEALAVGGIALAHSVYPDGGLRHGSSISLVVDAKQIGAARAQLEASGCLRRGDELCHPAGPPIRLRTTALRDPPIAGWREAAGVRIGGLEMKTAARELAVLERCEQALLGGSAQDLNWVCDLWFLSERCDSATWSRVARLAEGRTALVASEVFAYLRGLGAAVPAAVLDEVHASAARAPHSEVRAALHAASRSGQTNAWSWLRGCAAPADRIRLLRYGLARRASALLGG